MKGLLAAHSGLRYIVLLLLLIAVFNAIANLKSDQYSKKDKLINLLAFISVHTQLLVGLVVYFLSPKVQFTGTMMKNAISRFYTMEHVLMMLIAIILITVGKGKAERKESPDKIHKGILIYYGIALILIFFAIPWPFIRNVGAGYF